MQLDTGRPVAEPAPAPEPPSAPDALYYVANFCALLDTLALRDDDLLSAEERGFIDDFRRLPVPSQALLVRMIMRKGPLFRVRRLRYPEIPHPTAAATPLFLRGWVNAHPPLTLADVSGLFTKSELVRAFGLRKQCLAHTKSALFEELRAARDDAASEEARPLEQWGEFADAVWGLAVSALCLRLRLMFFGNFHQDLREFVLSDLGVRKYERVALDEAARPFRTRHDVEVFLAMYACREHMTAGADAADVERELPPAAADCEWLDDRREKLRFQIARAHERAGAVAQAAALYRECSHPQARDRAARLALAASGFKRIRARPAAVPSFVVCLPQIARRAQVERAVELHLRATADEPSQVFYVENALVNSLFGLLCWSAVFAPVSGAFFHRFQREPADLWSTRFHQRRLAQFAECLGHIDTGRHAEVILERFAISRGVASAFVAWTLLDEPLLRLALDCVPPRDLKAWFEWMLVDLRTRTSGFPDLVQFYPASRRYRLIEVKAPGDRLQVNQRRCIEFMRSHGMPVSVCHVRWRDG